MIPNTKNAKIISLNARAGAMLGRRSKQQGSSLRRAKMVTNKKEVLCWAVRVRKKCFSKDKKSHFPNLGRKWSSKNADFGDILICGVGTHRFWRLGCTNTLAMSNHFDSNCQCTELLERPVALPALLLSQVELPVQREAPAANGLGRNCFRISRILASSCDE
jgi:hypothetical protein